MTKRHGYALLSAVIAMIVAVSTAIYVGVGFDDGAARDTMTGGRSPRNNPAAPASTGVWVGTWSTAPAGAEPGTEPQGMAGRSVRNVVHAGVGGTAARVTLSNLYGQQPLSITHASIAVAATANNAAAAADTMRRLTFRGNPSVIVPPGQQVVSDAARLLIPHNTDILVTTYSPTPSGPVTYHPTARQISYTAEGDRTEDVTGVPYAAQTRAWRYLTAVDVLSNESEGTVVVIGDSLTDGVTATMGENRRWTDALAGRLRDRARDRDGSDGPRYSVINQGISGNRLLAGGGGRPAGNPSGLNRFDRDVLGRTNVKAVVIALGVNDILRTPHVTDADKITAGLRELTRRAHDRGLRVIGATLMPFQGHRGYRPHLEATRQAVNAQIRSGDIFDDYVDFDEALRDPYNPRRLNPLYDSGDHLHPSDRGYKEMAKKFDLDMLKGAAPAEL